MPFRFMPLSLIDECKRMIYIRYRDYRNRTLVNVAPRRYIDIDLLRFCASRARALAGRLAPLMSFARGFVNIELPPRGIE